MSRKKESGNKWVKLLVKLFSYQLDNCIYYNPEIALHSCRIYWTTFSLLLIGSFFSLRGLQTLIESEMNKLCGIVFLKIESKKAFFIKCNLTLLQSQNPMFISGSWKPRKPKNLIIEGFQCRCSKFKWLNVSVDSPCRMKIDSMHSLVT